MSGAVMGTRYSPPSPPETQSSSETMSPIYPERPIKPLPKRRLKDRLSSDAAETISYPAAPQASNTLFQSTHETNNQRFQQNLQNGSTPDIDQALIDAQAGYPSSHGAYEFRGTDPPSDDETGRPESYRSHAVRAPSHSVTSAESDHGYDSFENSNNKKKRKIPTSSNSGVLHPSLAGISQDLAKMGLSSTGDGADAEDGGTQQYYGQGYPAVPVSGTGISGAGRGRYGRSGRRDSRSPLSASANASNWQNGRMASARLASGKYSGKADHSEGIISQAIANAAASPIPADKGQENVSLLDQQQHRVPKKNTPGAQFTFNLDAEVAKGPAWPGDRHHASQYPSPPPPLPPQQLPPNSKGYSQGTQTSPPMASQGQQGGQGAQPAPPPKPRRPASARYARAARQRKSDQEYQNFHHPPSKQDMWICEFCEYEAIWGAPPRALIRQYEAKDAKERRKQAERKRLLDKAKSKGRKARKGTKAAKANAAAAAAPTNGQGQQSQQYADNGQPPLDPNQPQSDEYYSGDAYDDDGDPPISTPNPVPTKIPGPVGAPYGASQRPVDRSTHVAEGKRPLA